MKIIAFSDSHGRFDLVEKLFQKTRHYADVYVFCGDGIADVENMQYLYPEKQIYLVAGNCDYRSNERRVLHFDADSHRVMVTHGHIFNVKYGTGALVKQAADDGCDVVIFGHTHKRKAEYHNGIHLINPGSLALPDFGDEAGYAVIDIVKQGVVVSHMEL